MLVLTRITVEELQKKNQVFFNGPDMFCLAAKTSLRLCNSLDLGL